MPQRSPVSEWLFTLKDTPEGQPDNVSIFTQHRVYSELHITYCYRALADTVTLLGKHGPLDFSHVPLEETI